MCSWKSANLARSSIEQSNASHKNLRCLDVKIRQAMDQAKKEEEERGRLGTHWIGDSIDTDEDNVEGFSDGSNEIRAKGVFIFESSVFVLAQIYAFLLSGRILVPFES